MFNIQDSMYAVKILGISFDKFTPEELLNYYNNEIKFFEKFLQSKLSR